MFLRLAIAQRAWAVCRRRSLTALALMGTAFGLAPLTSTAQGTPTLQGTYVPDNNNGPRIVSPSVYGTAFYALSGDLTTLVQRTNTATPIVCPAPASADPAVNGPRAIVNDTQNAYVLAPNTGGANVSVTGLLVGSSICTRANSLVLSGSLPAQALLSNDVFHGKLYVLKSYTTGASDSITVINNLNNGTGTTISQGSQTFLDTGATYTSMVTDVTSTYGLVAITELKTATSPGNLWVFSPGINVAFKILGPGGTPLPASSAFIIPAKNDGGGNLLVLVNQDNLTAANLSTTPADTTPFTIIDLGQLQRAFSAVVANGNTITLPPLSTIAATSTYAAMLGAAFDPVTKLIYAATGSGGSLAGKVYSYDPYNPSTPAETNVADISNVPYAFGAYPQVTINSASGTMQILSASPTGLYSTNITGTGNTAVQVPGSTFPDGNFQPAQLTSNPLLGQTYIASPASSQIDILTKPAANPLRATVTLSGADTAISGQSYYLKGTSLYSVGDTDLINAPVTLTITPATGTPYTVMTTVGNIAYPGGSIPGVTFPSAGVYTLVATAPATATHAAITSNTIQVRAAATATAGVYPTTLTLSVPATAATGTVTANLTLNGSTYAPTGRIIVSDVNGEVGRYTFTGGATTYPVTATLTLPNGSSNLTATYNGDDQNSTSTSGTSTVNVGGAGVVTPTLTLTAPTGGTVGGTLSGNVTFASTSTSAPTDVISIYAVPSGTMTPMTVATIPATQAFATGGKAFTFTAPAAGSYTLLAYYPGDTSYNTAQSATTAFTSSAGKGTINLTLSIPATANSGTTYSGSITTSISGGNTATPTGIIAILAVSTSGNSVVLAEPLAANAKTSNVINFTFTAPAVGNYTVQARFGGDSNFNFSTSATVNELVTGTQQITTIGVSAPAVVDANTSFNVTVMLKPIASASVPPTGNIIVQAVPLIFTTDPYPQIATIPASLAIASGGVVVQGKLPTPGQYQYQLEAKYAGDANYGASVGVIPINIVFDPALSLTASAKGYVGTPLSVRYQLRTLNGTGNIILTSTSNGSTGPGVVLPVYSADLIPLVFQAPGTYTINGTYTGDVANHSVKATPITVVIAPQLEGPQFTMTLDKPEYGSPSTPLQIDGDSSRDMGITFTPVNGFSSPVNLAVDLPISGDAYFTNDAGVKVTSVVVTSAGGHVNLHLVNTHKLTLSNNRSTPFGGKLGGITLCGLAGFTLFGLRRKLRNKSWSLTLGILVVLCCGAALPGCGHSTQLTGTVKAVPDGNVSAAATQTLTFYVDSYQ